MKNKLICFLFTILLIPLKGTAFGNETNLYLEQLQSVCWYQDLRYSEGSVIKQADKLYVCSYRYQNQPQSPLMWLKLDKNGDPVRVEMKGKIRVH
ncbi:YnjH family protein [Pseudoalteromonas sp. DL2-H2.2]|uniref:DUF1496 domain-containing protein n=1 Tax=Pseudoalteromonas sp. DL2-H2.2 TaxID=2908889 RepID=UPI001F34C8D5|nr:DUF1496 domain-containing protein [Pseudoalteromonas sp. DL2-H2.2]MCF2906792.1 YnjH family protein [Pseudoalteromonas sp. DL2-H2.2]